MWGAPAPLSKYCFISFSSGASNPRSTIQQQTFSLRMVGRGESVLLTKTFIIVIMGFGSFFSLPSLNELKARPHSAIFFRLRLKRLSQQKIVWKVMRRFSSVADSCPRLIFPGVTFGKGLVLEHLSWPLYHCWRKINRNLRHLHALSWAELRWPLEINFSRGWKIARSLCALS